MKVNRFQWCSYCVRIFHMLNQNKTIWQVDTIFLMTPVTTIFFCNPQATAYFVCEWSMIGCWYKNRSSCVVSTGLLITQIRSKQLGVETLGQVFRFCNQPKQIRVNCVNVGVFDFFELRQRYYWQISTVSDHSDQFRWSLIKSNKTRFISPTIWIELFCDQIRHARCNFLFPLVFHSLRSL